MQLEDLLSTPNNELSDTQLEAKILVLSKLKFRATKKPTSTKSSSASAPKSNHGKQIKSVTDQIDFSSLTPEQRQKVKEVLGV